MYDDDEDEEVVKNKNAELLASCYKTSLELAVKHDLKHIVRDPFNHYGSSH
jgi:hypothetical protein